MGMKSRLFASAAFPLLSLTLAVTPVHASALGGTGAAQSPQAISGSYEVAQDAPSEEELLKKRHKQPEAEQRQQQEAAPQAEQQQEAPSRKQREAAPQAEEAAPQAEQAQPSEEQQPRRKKREAAPEPEQAAPQAEPAQPAENQEQPRRKKREAAPEAQQQEQAAPQAEPTEQPAEKPRRKRDQQPEQQEAAPAQNEAQPQVEQAKPEVEKAKPKAEEAKPQTEEAKPQAGEAKPAVTDEAKPEQQRPRKGDKKQQATEGEQQQEPAAKPGKKNAQQAEQPAEGKTPVPTESPAPDQAPVPAESPVPAKPPVPAEPGQAQKPAAEGQPQQGEQQLAPGQQPGANTAEQPAVNGQQPVAEQAIPAPEKVTPQELERRKQIAADPSKSTETVVLPVENGAAVLDSDKDADRSGGRDGRRQRDKQRADEQQPVFVPKSDADAQRAAGGEARPPVKIEAVTAEEGRRLDRRPQFQRPDGAQVEGRVGDDNRVLLQINNNIVVRSDDDRRFIRDGERPMYEQLPRDRYRETIDRPDGYRIVTIRNRYGDIIQRSRVDSRGREYVLYYSPELYDNPDQDYFEDPGADLPPMRLRIPVRDYIIDTSSDPDRDYYDFLREPPVEPVERVYSLNEVKYSARIRDKVRRIDLDTITFATGSAEIPMSQARSLRKVADALNEVLQKDPSETFLIEGHTDAVGSDQSNLVLSDQRAESVANVLSDVYGIPPENMATQGYGERYLKVNTAGPNQENRRVTIRRVTPLVRPVASNN